MDIEENGHDDGDTINERQTSVRWNMTTRDIEIRILAPHIAKEEDAEIEEGIYIPREEVACIGNTCYDKETPAFHTHLTDNADVLDRHQGRTIIGNGRIESTENTRKGDTCSQDEEPNDDGQTIGGII